MLTNHQISQFNRTGYLVIENVISPALLDHLKIDYANRMTQMYERWCSEGKLSPNNAMDMWQQIGAANQAGLDWFQPLDISLPHENIQKDTEFYFGPSAFELITNPAILNIVASLLGEELTSNPIQHVRIKPPASYLSKNENRAHVGATSWHQDRAVTLPEADNTQMITVWVAISDANKNNGCLQVIPNPPQNVLVHCPKQQITIADKLLEQERAVFAEVKAGGIVLLNPLTPHSAGDNRSEQYRWSFDLRYHVTDQASGRSQFPEFVVRSCQNPLRELHDWRQWRSSWEQARYRLANQTHIPQHRWHGKSPLCA